MTEYPEFFLGSEHLVVPPSDQHRLCIHTHTKAASWVVWRHSADEPCHWYYWSMYFTLRTGAVTAHHTHKQAAYARGLKVGTRSFSPDSRFPGFRCPELSQCPGAGTIPTAPCTLGALFVLHSRTWNTSPCNSLRHRAPMAFRVLLPVTLWNTKHPWPLSECLRMRAASLFSSLTNNLSVQENRRDYIIILLLFLQSALAVAKSPVTSRTIEFLLFQPLVQFVPSSRNGANWI